MASIPAFQTQSSVSFSPRQAKTPSLSRIASQEDVFGKAAVKLMPESFSLNMAKSFVILTDLEPDDLMTLRDLLPEIGKRPVALVSGGANAAIQNERAKKFVEACKDDGLFPDGTGHIQFIRGCDSEQEFPRQGEESLDPDTLAKLQKEKNDVPEPGKIESFFDKHSDTHVFCLKRPDEMAGNSSLLNMIQKKKATLHFYAGGFNVNYNTKEERAKLLEFLNAFDKVAVSQAFNMLQAGETPGDITEKNTPRFFEKLNSDTKSYKLIRKTIAIWNEKTAFAFAQKAKNIEPNTIPDPVQKASQETAQKVLVTLPEKEDFRLTDQKTIFTLLKALPFIKPNIAPNKIEQWRYDTLKSIAENPETQTAIADQLTLMPHFAPELLPQSVQGTLSYTMLENGRFVLQVTPDPNGKCLENGLIYGSAGKKGERIKFVDNFLAKGSKIAKKIINLV